METASKRREKTCFMKMEIKEKISLGFISSYARTWWPFWIAILGAQNGGVSYSLLSSRSTGLREDRTVTTGDVYKGPAHCCVLFITLSIFICTG